MKSKKKKKKFGITKLLLIFSFVAIVAIGIYLLLTAKDSNTGLTLVEKQWIEKNKDTLIDFSVPNNLSILGKDGEGVLYDLVDNIKEDTSLSFNIVTYNYPEEITSEFGIAVLKNTDKMLDDDLLIAEDSYILIGKEDEYISDISKVNGVTVGTLNDDSQIIKDYFDEKNVTVKSYSTLSKIIKAITDGEIVYAAVPRYLTLSLTVKEENIYTNYALNNITNKVVLRTSNSNSRLSNILTKYVEKFKETKLRNSLEESLMNFYDQNIGISSLEKANLTSKTFKYGYVDNSVYNVKKNKKIYGIAGEYINTLSNMANIEFEYIPYKTKADLVKAIENKKVDVAFIDFDYENEDALSTKTPFILKMVALSKEYQNVSDRFGLANRKVYLLKDDFLSTYITGNNNSFVNKIEKISSNIPSDGILVIDENEYLYYKDTELSNYKALFTDYYKGNVRFDIISDDEVLYKLTNFVLDNTDYNEYKNIGINNLFNSISRESNFKNIYLVILLIVLIPILVSIIITIIKKLTVKITKYTKEDILKYNDMLTSLKNRNYLNSNMDNWNNTKIYPKTIIIIDLNNLKYVNDNYGTRKGNELIKKAAAILINTQLEKSEMVRSDGNEFLIYLIGYSKTQINSYVQKLSRELEKLPYGFGAAFGYSMIDDEIKTIEDAINEATINMRKDKEQNYK